jgi:hypothetical protein
LAPTISILDRNNQYLNFLYPYTCGGYALFTSGGYALFTSGSYALFTSGGSAFSIIGIV